MSRLPPGLHDSQKRVLAGASAVSDTMEFIKYGAETDGKYTLIRCRAQPGAGPPLHYHRTYTETFTSLSGVLTMTLDGKESSLHENESSTVPITHVHRFENKQKVSDTDNGEVVFECKLEPAHEGFEKSWYIIYGLARDGQIGKDAVPKSLVNTCILSVMGDINLAGLGWSLGMPVVRLIARWARAMGWERQLVEKYWC